MARIDTRYIDLDLSVTPENIADNPGLLDGPEPETLGSFGDLFPQHMVPRSQWAERCDATEKKRRATTMHIYSQGRTSACVGFSIAQAVETTLTRRYGKKHARQLAGMDVYRQPGVGSTLMSGAMIRDGINAVVKNGVLPLDTQENRDLYKHVCGLLDYDKSAGRNTDYNETRKLFRVTKWATCSGADEIFSALLSDFCGVVGRSRHAIPYCAPYHDRGSFFSGYPNSWGSWGDNGWGYDSERTFGNLTMYVILDVAARPDLEIPLA